MDPAIVRLICALLILFTGFGIPAYIILALILEENPYNVEDDRINQEYISENPNPTLFRDIFKNRKPASEDKDPIDVEYRETTVEDYKAEEYNSDEPIGFKVEDAFRNK